MQDHLQSWWHSRGLFYDNDALTVHYPLHMHQRMSQNLTLFAAVVTAVWCVSSAGWSRCAPGACRSCIIMVSVPWGLCGKGERDRQRVKLTIRHQITGKHEHATVQCYKDSWLYQMFLISLFFILLPVPTTFNQQSSQDLWSERFNDTTQLLASLDFH